MKKLVLIMIKNYGITQIDNVVTDTDYHIECILRKGFTVLKNQINPSEVNELRYLLEKVYSVQENDFGSERLEKIKEKNIVRAPFLYESIFESLILNDSCLEIVEGILGSVFTLHLQNSIINRASNVHHQSSWHRDIPYQEYTLSKPISVNVFFALSPFNEKTGGTIFLPYSNKFDNFPSERFLNDNAVQPTLEPGDVVIFDSWLYHKAGNNISDIDRYGVNHVFTSPILKQQIDFPILLNEEDIENDKLKELLGFRFASAKNVNEFREKRYQRNSK